MRDNIITWAVHTYIYVYFRSDRKYLIVNLYEMVGFASVSAGYIKLID